MKRFLVALLSLLAPLMVSAQINMSVNGRAMLDADDNDARSYYALKDINDLDCAIIKVGLNNPVNGTLVLHTKGGVATVKSEKQTDGEWWFWVSPKVTNIMFSCEGYTPTDYVGVSLKGKNVYRLKLTVDAAVATVTTFTLGESVMKLNVTPPDATVFYGRTESCDMGSRKLTDGLFEAFLDKGTYYYRVESRFYETKTGKYEVSDDSEEMQVTLTPTFSYLSLNTNPQGAEVFLNGRLIGTTPIAQSDKIRKGNGVKLEFRKDDYYIEPVTIDVVGDGKVQQVPTVDLRPQFGWVTCLCDDPDAELTVRDATKVIATGRSGMRVKLNSGGTAYKLEASRPSHVSQAQGIKGSAIEGKEVLITVDKPLPIYGGLQLTSNPSRAKVYIDGAEAGTTALSKRLLIGTHTVELIMEDYHLDPFTVVIEEGQTCQVSKTMLPGAKIVYGNLNVTTGSVTGASVNIRGNDINKSMSSPAYTTLPTGSYSIVASKPGFKSASTSVIVREGRTTNASLNLRKEVRLVYWDLDDEENGFARHFVDTPIALVDWDAFAFGLHYAYCHQHLGVYGQYLYVPDYDDHSVSAGAVLRLTDDLSKVDWQLYGGAGWMYYSFGGEIGTRLGWHSDNLSWFDFGVGLQFHDGSTTPVFQIGFGISLSALLVLLAALGA